jgi:hypothetical protein
MVSSTGADMPVLRIAGLGDSYMEDDWLSAVQIPGYQIVAAFNDARRKARKENIGRYGGDRTLLGSVQAGAQKLQLAALAEFANNLGFPLDVTLVFCCGVDAGFGEVMWRTSRLGPGCGTPTGRCDSGRSARARDTRTSYWPSPSTRSTSSRWRTPRSCRSRGRP